MFTVTMPVKNTHIFTHTQKMLNFKAISLCGIHLQTVLADFQNYQNKNTHVQGQTNHHTHTHLCINIEEYRNSDLKPSNSIQVLVSLLINYQKLTHQFNVLHFPRANKNQTKESYHSWLQSCWRTRCTIENKPCSLEEEQPMSFSPSENSSHHKEPRQKRDLKIGYPSQRIISLQHT